MTTAVELLRQGRRHEFWQRYCGFLDLSIDEFMAIQQRLLIEQLQMLAGSEFGQKAHRPRRSANDGGISAGGADHALWVIYSIL